MDKKAIKSFAVWAREELIKKVSQKAEQYEITEKYIVSENGNSVCGHILNETERKQRNILIRKINKKSYEQVIEEVAYDWFKRFIALRFMEVNGYLSDNTHIFTYSSDNNTIGRIQAEENDKNFIISQCNELSRILPCIFEEKDDFTELLFPDDIFGENSVISNMISGIQENEWKDAVQIVGWLYQYYNSVNKDKVFANLKNNIKIEKEDIPAATQLFTPDWIVRYMVENSLGKLWLDGHPDDVMKAQFKYYIEEAVQERGAEDKISKIRDEYKNINPEEIKCIDPCSGSGHICAYMFDVLMQIYFSCGYSACDAVKSIIENNIYALDIDERAAELTYFSVMMKARQYDSLFFSRKDARGNPDVPQPKVYPIYESNGIDSYTLDYFTNCNEKIKEAIDSVVVDMYDAKEYGSAVNVKKVDFDLLYSRFDEVQNDINICRESVLNDLLPVVKVAQVLSEKYNVVATNPPYMGRKSLNAKLSSYLEANYENGKTELYAAFIERCANFAKQNGLIAMVTMHTWMFISSFKKLRKHILTNENIVSMMHTGAATFEELNSFNVLATAFIRRKGYIDSYIGTYLKLNEYYSTDEKLKNLDNPKNLYLTKQNKFFSIQEQPIVYWLDEKTYDVFETSPKIEDYGQLTNGLFTCDNARFVRLWHEVSVCDTNFNCHSALEADASNAKWFPYVKGGNFRKWYGNNEYVVNYQNNGAEIREYRVKQGQSKKFPGEQFYFMPGITWAPFGFENFGVRYKYHGDIFDIAGSSLFVNNPDDELYILSFLASKVGFYLLSTVAPTVNFQIGNIGSLPLIKSDAYKSKIDSLAEENIRISKEEWDDYETSWNFRKHPLLNSGNSLAQAYEQWEKKANSRYDLLRKNEEEINSMFIEIYHTERCVEKDVVDRDIALRRADKERDIKSLISYAVGCMLGRYSLDAEGLAYAGGDWDSNKYKIFKPAENNIIPICDDEYFEDDITGRFVNFIEVVYGKETLQENLEFIATALGGKGNPTEVIRKYFISDFYADHIKTYQKRPIYWLFDSGKKNGFKALIYIHRYNVGILSQMLTDYVQKRRQQYREIISDTEKQLAVADIGEKKRITKQLAKPKEKIGEIDMFEEKIQQLADRRIKINLDDGVKHNYELFGDVLK